jgi:hypothetical protein
MSHDRFRTCTLTVEDFEWLGEHGGCEPSTDSLLNHAQFVHAIHNCGSRVHFFRELQGLRVIRLQAKDNIIFAAENGSPESGFMNANNHLVATDLAEITSFTLDSKFGFAG